MKNLSFSFIALSFAVFLLFSFFLYILEISSFLFPHIPIMITLLFSEKKIKKRIILILLAAILYSQTGSPVPLFFIVFISLQIYCLTSVFFSFTAFDFSLTALVNCLLLVFIINLNRFFYIFLFTGELKIFHLLIYSSFSSLILLSLYIFFKKHIDGFFVKDSWL